MAFSPSWRLDALLARLQLPQLTAAIDLARPDNGLGDVHLGPAALPAARLLAVGIPALSAGASGRLIEHYVRGDDLITAYEASADWPVRVDAMWRAASPAPDNPVLATIDLIVSVRTQLLDSQPELAVETTVAASESLRLVDAASARYQPALRKGTVPFSSDENRDSPPLIPSPGMTQSTGEIGCLVFRLPHAESSYAEMVHPLDFLGDVLEPAGELVRLRHRLFAEHLEKGVILRARVRGVFVPRRDDLRLAADCYRAFAAAEPPLGA